MASVSCWLYFERSVLKKLSLRLVMWCWMKLLMSIMGLDFWLLALALAVGVGFGFGVSCCFG